MSNETLVELIGAASDVAGNIFLVYIVSKIIMAVLFVILVFKVINIRENAEITATNTEAIYGKLEKILIKLDEIQETQEDHKTESEEEPWQAGQGK